MQPFADALVTVLAEAILLSAINLLPLRQLKSIDATLKELRGDLLRNERRIDQHDQHARIDTRSPLRLQPSEG